MPDYGYIECDSRAAAAAAATRRAAEASVESLYDREIRIRVGELIARAMQAANRDKR